MPEKNIHEYGNNCEEVAGTRIPNDLSNSTREVIQDHDACAKHNTPRIEIRTIDSDQQVVQPERNVSDTAILDSYSSTHQRSEY